jgi:hypothetical protein
LYISGVPGKTDKKTLLSYREGQGLAYAIYSDLDRVIDLLVPPTPEALSQVPSAKLAACGGWSVAVRPRTADGMLSPVFCGYVSGGAGTVSYPMPPSWSDVSVGVFDERRNKVCGNLVTHGSPDNGFSFKLVFRNNQDKSDVVRYTVERVTGLGTDMHIAVIDPAGGLTKDAESPLIVTVAENSSEYRWLAIGTPEYIKGFGRTVVTHEFGLVRIASNPFRGSLRIDYTVPAGGMDKVLFNLIDQRGRVVWSASTRNARPGENRMVWDPKTGRGLASGIYVLRMSGFDGSGKRQNVRQSRVMYLRP